ncbi:16201_t:CDS:1 [Funneliformis caledonium]|uniref:16201_t:CDS:1 n=1 Tax=Funneliformis caledonium TaxID=1117310 RepID=A0A9N9FZB6_9GLOM|nr:16201_t:CDS:1 [Funneliformis caledonium]
MKKRKVGQIDNSTHPSIVQQHTLLPLLLSLPSDTNHLKKIRRITTNAEKAILNQLFEFGEKPPEIAILKYYQNFKLSLQTRRLKESNNIGEITPTRFKNKV